MLGWTPVLLFQSEKVLLYDQVRADLTEKIRRLEEDRHNIDISSGEKYDASQYVKKEGNSKNEPILMNT